MTRRLIRGASSTLVALLLVFALTSPAHADFLGGFVAYVWGDVVNEEGRVYVFKVDGTYCGTAILPFVGPPSMATVAFEAAKDSLLAQSPGGVQHFSGWHLAPDGSPSVICGASVGVVNSYYFRY